MKKIVILSLLLSFQVTAFAGLTKDTPRQLLAYLEIRGVSITPVPFVIASEEGVLRLASWTAGIPLPADTDLTDPAVLDMPKGLRKIQGSKWVAKTPAELEAEDLALNGGIYAYQNVFLLLCDRVRGNNSHEKLPFETLPGLLKAIRKGGDKARFEDLRDSFNTINQALIKKAGVNWWDTCVWNTNETVIATAQAIYAGLLNP